MKNPKMLRKRSRKTKMIKKKKRRKMRSSSKRSKMKKMAKKRQMILRKTMIRRKKKKKIKRMISQMTRRPKKRRMIKRLRKKMTKRMKRRPKKRRMIRKLRKRMKRRLRKRRMIKRLKKKMIRRLRKRKMMKRKNLLLSKKFQLQNHSFRLKQKPKIVNQQLMFLKNNWISNSTTFQEILIRSITKKPCKSMVSSKNKVLTPRLQSTHGNSTTRHSPSQELEDMKLSKSTWTYLSTSKIILTRTSLTSSHLKTS